MTPSAGYSKAKPGRVCKLLKSLYGLQQASKQWNIEFTKQLQIFGFQQSSADHCLFVKSSSTSFLALLVYVDDVLITGTNAADIEAVKKFLHAKFTIKDLGAAKFFLGIEVARSPSGIFLNQWKYVLDILEDTGLLGSKPVSTPLLRNFKFIATSTPHYDPERYRRLVGRLLYLNLTRPGISYTVQQLSQFVNSPYHQHWDAATHLL